MFISRQSEPPTVLLWSDRWWFANGESCEFSSLTHAVEVLAAHFAAETHPVRLRLIYQPRTLASIAVACPRGNRATLQQALGFDHPAIADPAHAWSHEPILAQAEGYGTIVHFEQEPGLFPLVERLARHGVNVATVWPLATYLHALPAERSESGAVLVIATGADHAMAYHHPANGNRTLHQWHGDTAAAEATAWLGKEMAKTPDEPTLMIAASGSDHGAHGMHCLPLAEALSRPVILPRSHPAQLLPAMPFVTPQHWAVAASIVLLLTGGWTGAAYARNYVAWTGQQQANVREKSALRAEIAHYRINTAEIVTLRAQLAGPGSSPPVGEMLDAVCGTLPPQIALDRVRVAQGRFTLSGHVAPGAAAAWDQWRTQLGSKRWTLEPSPAPRETGAFTLSGVFLP